MVFTGFSRLRADSNAGFYNHSNEHLRSVNCKDFLTIWVTVSFSRKILCHGVGHLPSNMLDRMTVKTRRHYSDNKRSV